MLKEKWKQIIESKGLEEIFAILTEESEKGNNYGNRVPLRESSHRTKERRSPGNIKRSELEQIVGAYSAIA